MGITFNWIGQKTGWIGQKHLENYIYASNVQIYSPGLRLKDIKGFFLHKTNLAAVSIRLALIETCFLNTYQSSAVLFKYYQLKVCY